MVANIYDVVYNVSEFLWVQKVQILGGLFLALTIYSYLYRVYLYIERRKRIEALKNAIKSIKLVMTDKKASDLEHEILDLKIKRVNSDIDLRLRVISAENRAEFEVLNLRFDKFDAFATAAEKRIEALEGDTSFIRDAKKRSWVIGLALIGLITIVNFNDIASWIKGLFQFK